MTSRMLSAGGSPPCHLLDDVAPAPWPWSPRGEVSYDTAATAGWARTAIPESDVVASFAYREVAYRLDRPVVPLGYTGDMERLWGEASAAGARWLVVMPSLYGARGALEDRFVATFADRLRLVHDTATVDTYAVTGS